MTAAVRSLARIALLAAALTGVGCDEPPQSVEAADEVDGERTLPVRLYFPAEDGLLHAEERAIVPIDDPEGRVRMLIEDLLTGPVDPSLLPPFPPGVSLDSVFISDTGVAYLDLGADGSPRPPLAGSRQELLAVYSLVDSTLLNVPEVRSVAVLWNGQQRASFAGHVDTSRPLVIDQSYLAETP